MAKLSQAEAANPLMAEMHAALRQAVKAAGGPAKLGPQLGITATAVRLWKIVPLNRALSVEAATGVSRDRLRPDHYARTATAAPWTPHKATAPP